MIITIEGLPGAGKSTQASALARCLRAAGRRVTLLPDLGSLPTPPVTEQLVELLRSTADPYLRTGDAITDTLITAAIRADLVATIIDPAQAADPAAVIIEDRGIHTMCSYALASLLHEHRTTERAALDWLRALTDLAGPRPGQALWLRLPPDQTIQRAAERAVPHHGPRAGQTDLTPTAEQVAYLGRVHQAYGLLAEHDPGLQIVEAVDLDQQQTHHAIHRALAHAGAREGLDSWACRSGGDQAGGSVGPARA